MTNHVRDAYETLAGEGLKTAAEEALHLAGSNEWAKTALANYASGGQGRIEDPRLVTNVAGMVLENPLMVGAGWDKQGRCLHGLYALGFAGVEVGTVLHHRQNIGPKPRMWTIDQEHKVGLNRLKFNSPGMYTVANNLEEAQPYPGIVGLNVGRNATTPNESTPEDHAKVIRHLGGYANYIVLNLSSPNTESLRELQDIARLEELIVSAQEAMPSPVPLFIKLDAERTADELYSFIEAAIYHGLSGFVATNSYAGSDLKAAYGERWAREPGGLSGADPRFQALSTRTIRFLYQKSEGMLAIIGAGGVHDTDSALSKIRAGASAVQVVTAMRPSWGKAGAQINRGLLEQIEKSGYTSIKDFIGEAALREYRHSNDNW